MAVALGKALFWDMQVGSDGVQACASCHFRAGADPRSKNQVSPGLRRAPAADLTYSTGTGPNHQLTASDFPLTRLATPGVRGALDPAADSNDAVSSQGIHHPGDEIDPQGFAVGAANTRRVEPRNTPSVINAVFNHRQFWDGRAENVFNGVNHLGQRDPDAKLFRADDPENPVEVRVELDERQPRVAGGGSDRERSRDGRTGPHSPRRRPRAGQGQTQPGQEGREGPSAGQAARVADRQRARLDEPVATARPLLQQIRPDDQGGLSREVVEGQEAHPRERGRIQDRGGTRTTGSARTTTATRTSTRSSSTTSRCSSGLPSSSTRRRSSPTIRPGTASAARTPRRPTRT